MAELVSDLGPAYEVSFSPDGSRLLRARQSVAHVHHADTGRELGAVRTGSGVYSLE
ncbi:hypothetical protein [Micromonospora sp. CPCC 206061]|uniref:hypothetical protein n=1 Tax=Micromonospora sp. CPCC 206061 TaxID=3122410 RepID=UPI002FEF6E49